MDVGSYAGMEISGGSRKNRMMLLVTTTTGAGAGGGGGGWVTFILVAIGEKWRRERRSGEAEEQQTRRF